MMEQATCFHMQCWLSRLAVPADLMTAVTSLMPDIIAAAQREPDAEAVAKAGAGNSLPC